VGQRSSGAGSLPSAELRLGALNFSQPGDSISGDSTGGAEKSDSDGSIAALVKRALQVRDRALEEEDGASAPGAPANFEEDQFDDERLQKLLIASDD
jgi:hypothetical protein